MFDRRTFLAGAAMLPFASAAADQSLPKLAVITTVWRYRSHSWHMAERFLGGYPVKGKWHRPPFQVVSAYVDQVDKDDLSRDRAKEFGFKIYPTIAETLQLGGKQLAVDGVLIIGEHGDYPLSEIGQKKYPRYEFFKQTADVFEKSGKTAPVFNDKHLSWDWQWAKEMVETSRRLKFPFLAGSSLPVTWRMPAIDVPYQAEMSEMLGVIFGPIDIYDFHGLEMMQSMAERRKGGETGVKQVHALKGDAVWNALAEKAWNPRLFEACLSRSQTLKQGPTTSHRYPTLEQMREWTKDPIAYRIEYRDGLKATLLMLNGLVDDFTFAATIKGQDEPISTLFYLPPNPNVTYSAALMGKAEEMFRTGKAPYPVERTLLTSGLVSACMESLMKKQALPTPHLDVVYNAPRESQFARE